MIRYITDAILGTVGRGQNKEIPTFINLAELAANLTKDIRKSGLKRKGWRVDLFTNNIMDVETSDKAVILMPDKHRWSETGLYNDVIGVVKPYISALGVESTIYGEPNALESYLEVLGPFLKPNFTYESLLESDKLFNYLDKSKIPTFGLGRRDLEILTTGLDSVRSAILTIIIGNGFEGKQLTQQEREILDDQLKKGYSCINLPQVEHYDPEILYDNGKALDSYTKINEVYHEYAVDRRSIESVVNIEKELTKNAAEGFRPNVVGALMGEQHIDIILECTRTRGIQLIVIYNVKKF